MVRFHASTTALLLAAGTVANAKPVLHHQARVAPSPTNVTARYDVGYDGSLVQTLKSTDIVPDVVYLDSDAYKTVASAYNVTTLEPFIPEDESSEILGKRWINGKDDRKQFTSQDYPWRNVGRM